MVIGHEDVDALPARLCHGLVRDDPAVARQNERGTRFPGSIEPSGPKVVSVSESVGHERPDVATEAPQPFCVERRAGHAVDIVVSVHEDRLAGIEGPQEPGNRGRDVAKCVREVELLEPRAKVGLGRLRR